MDTKYDMKYETIQEVEKYIQDQLDTTSPQHIQQSTNTQK